MEKIESFKVNHLKLSRGLYVSRIDCDDGKYVTTFDLRVTIPNKEPVMDTSALHTIEHLGATYLRNSNEKSKVIYFGPMGCRTGFYLVMFGKLKSNDVLNLVLDMCSFIEKFDGEIPGASPIECGNYLDQNLDMAKYYISRYKDSLIKEKNLVYPV